MNLRSSTLSVFIALVFSGVGTAAANQVEYVDADITAGSGNTVLDGPGSFGPTSSTTVVNDGVWSIRSWGVNGGGLLATNQAEDAAPRLATTYTLPGTGTYNIYGYFWNNKSGTGIWDAAFQLGSRASVTYTKANSSNLSATSGHFTSGVVVDDGLGQQLYEAPLGSWDTAIHGSTFTVYIDDPETASGDDRTWYDGVGFKPALPSEQFNYVAGDLITFNDNGAWCWYQDPRVVVDTNTNQFLISSIADASGTDGAARNGQVDVVAYNYVAETSSRFVLGTPGDDDHNVASFYMRSDGRYVTAWSRHGVDTRTNFRVSTNPGDATAWDATTTHNNAGSTTYENLYYLPGDDGGNGRLYNFTRTANFDPTLMVSSDEGLTWSASTTKLLTQGGGGDRPYLRYASDGDKIHFIATEEHPRDFNNSIYHGYVKDGKLFKSDGTQLDGNLFDNSAVGVNALTQVFAANTVNQGDPMTRAWTVDLEVDSTGNPYAVFQARIDPGALSGGQDSLDHRFFYARYDGTNWNVNALAEAGRDIYAASPNGSEDDYTGLVALDPNNPDVLYMSSDIDPRDSTDTNFYEIYKGVTDDLGTTWVWEAITENSTVDNLRPVVPDWDEQNTALLWMRGDYRTYRDWDTDIVGLVFTEPAALLPGDANGDGQVTAADLVILDANFGQPGGFSDGDFNGDGIVTAADLVILDANFGVGVGEASSISSQSVPEPSCLVVLLGGLLFARH